MTVDEEFTEQFNAAVAEINARNRKTARADEERASLWLTHHWADQYDRCAVVGGRHVCRRCLVFYPLSALLVLLSFVGVVPWPDSWDTAVIWTLSVIGSFDFVLEQLGFAPYRPRRQIGATVLIGVAFGRAAGIELQDRWSAQFWTPLLVFGALWLASAAWGNRHRFRDTVS